MNPYSAYGFNPGSVQLGMQAPASQLSPEQLAELQRIRGLGGQQQTFGDNLNLGGATPSVRPTAQQQLQGYIGKAGEAASRVGEKAQAALGAAGTAISALPLGRLGLLGGMVSPAMTAIGEAQEGRPTGALGALGGGAAGALAGAGIAKMLPGAYGKVAGAVLPLLGGMLGAPAGASALESSRQDWTGKPTKGKEEEFSTQLAMRGRLTEQDLSVLNRELGIRTSNIKDLTQFYNTAQVEQYKAMAPELEKAKMNDFARYQTAMALQGNIQGQLGVLATAGSLAQGAQAGNYALTQTALTTNPYAGATLQAPQIRFG